MKKIYIVPVAVQKALCYRELLSPVYLTPGAQSFSGYADSKDRNGLDFASGDENAANTPTGFGSDSGPWDSLW